MARREVHQSPRTQACIWEPSPNHALSQSVPTLHLYRTRMTVARLLPFLSGSELFGPSLHKNASFWDWSVIAHSSPLFVLLLEVLHCIRWFFSIFIFSSADLGVVSGLGLLQTSCSEKSLHESCSYVFSLQRMHGSGIAWSWWGAHKFIRDMEIIF